MQTDACDLQGSIEHRSWKGLSFVRMSSVLVLCLTSGLLLPGAGLCQSDGAVPLRGQVVDRSGATVAGAQVTIVAGSRQIVDTDGRTSPRWRRRARER